MAAVRATMRSRRMAPPTPTNPPARTCPTCGTAFKIRRKWAKYCSDKCRKLAFKLKHEENYISNLLDELSKELEKGDPIDI